jgi:geranylgeranyl pyrophosphate synthase
LAAGIAEDDARYIALIKYAENVGLAFQRVDDILDDENGELELNSFLSFMSVDEAREYSKQLTNDAINEIRFFDKGTLEDLANYLIFRKN